MPATNTTATPEYRLEQEVLEWTNSVYDEADQEMANSPELKLVGKLIDYIHGRQWSPQARFGRSRPVVNRLVRQFIEIVGQLTDISPEFKVQFYDHPDKASELEVLLNKLISLWADVSDFEGELSQVVIYGLLHTGYAKIQWNSALNNGMGDNEFIPASPINILETGSESSLYKGECVIYRVPVTMAYLKRRYGRIADAVRPDGGLSNGPAQMMRPAKMPSSQWAKLSPTLRNLLGKKEGMASSRYPNALLKEFWFKDDSIWGGSKSITVGNPDANWSYIVEPGMPIYPRGRVVITAGGKVLEDTCNPYWHSRFPFAKYRPYRVPWQRTGLSPMEPIAAIQNVVNRINGGVMDTINAAIEPTLVAPKAAFSQQGWDSLDPGAPGGKVQYNNNSPRPPEFRKPPELAGYVLQFAQELMKEQDASSGGAAMQQALQKKQVPGGDSLDTILSSKSVNIRLMGKSLKSFLNDGGYLIACNLMQFSPAKRRARIFGGEGLTEADFTPTFGELLPKGMEGEEFVRSMSFSVKKLNLASERETETQIAFGLRKNKDLSRKNLFRLIKPDFDQKRNEDELLLEATQQMGIAALGAAAQGKHKK